MLFSRLLEQLFQPLSLQDLWLALFCFQQSYLRVKTTLVLFFRKLLFLEVQARMAWSYAVLTTLNKIKSCTLLRLLEKQNALHLPVFSIFFSTTFRKYRENRSQNYFTDHQTDNTIQLFVATKINFSGLFFF